MTGSDTRLFDSVGAGARTGIGVGTDTGTGASAVILVVHAARCAVHQLIFVQHS